jgi:hypothetical protein
MGSVWESSGKQSHSLVLSVSPAPVSLNGEKAHFMRVIKERLNKGNLRFTIAVTNGSLSGFCSALITGLSVGETTSSLKTEDTICCIWTPKTERAFHAKHMTSYFARLLSNYSIFLDLKKLHAEITRNYQMDILFVNKVKQFKSFIISD